MAEAFGVAVNVVTVLQAVAETVAFLQSVKKAPSERRQLLEELRRMRNSLESLQSFILDRDDESAATWRADLEQLEQDEHALQQCVNAMQKLNAKLGPMDKHGLSKVAHAFTWPLAKQEVHELLDSIARAEKSVDRMLYKANASQTLQIADGVKTLNDRANDDELTKLLDWFCDNTYDQVLQDKLPKPPGTFGQWFLNDPVFLQWAAADRGAALFCPGLPGGGKTVIASLAIRVLQKSLKADHAVVFLYCDHKRQQKQSIVHIMSSIIRQLIECRRSAPEPLFKLWKIHQKKHTWLIEEDIRSALHIVLSIHQRVHVVIDALDEASDDTQSQLTKLLVKLRSDYGISFMVTSRDLPHIQERFAVSSIKCGIRIKADAGDIHAYVVNRQSEFSPTIRRKLCKKPGLLNDLIHSIVKLANGMFLLARLVMDNLIDTARTPAQLTQELQTMPTRTYEAAYSTIFERLRNQSTWEWAQAFTTLSWIVRARELLSPLMLQRALVITPGDDNFDEDNIPEIHDILASCHGLVIVDEQSNVIRLVHMTAHEYLQSNQHVLLPNADSMLAGCCLTYYKIHQAYVDLVSLDLSTPNNDDPLYFITARHAGVPSKGRYDPLYFYTARYAGVHAKDLEQRCDYGSVEELVKLILRLEFGRPQMIFQTQERDDLASGCTAWHFFARYNLHRSMSLTMREMTKYYSPNSNMAYPLHYAASYNAPEVVELI